MKPFLDAFRLVYLTESKTVYAKKYMPNGLRPAETFYSDIVNNLVKWARDEDQFPPRAYYETTRYWYQFMVEDTDVGRSAKIVWIRRYELNAATCITCFVPIYERNRLSEKWHIYEDPCKQVNVE